MLFISAKYNFYIYIFVWANRCCKICFTTLPICGIALRYSFTREIMAEKEVQISKSVAVSTASSGKKTTSASTKSQVVKPSTSGLSSQPSLASTSGKSISSQKESGVSGTPPLRELVDILRVLNTNVNAQSERLDKQSQRIDEIMNQWNECENDPQFDYEYEEDTESIPCQFEPEGDFIQESLESTSTASIFKKLSNKFQQSEQVDVDVHPDLANLVNNSFRNGLSDDNLDEISKQILRPENCDSLVKTHVNQGIWRLVKSFTQSEDSRLTAIQGVLLKASVNLVKLVEKLGLSNSEHVELGTTAIALLGHANKMINTKRKDLRKADLDYKYHYLASASLPYTDLLYGNDTDVNNNVREINNMNRIGRSTGRGGGPMRNQGRGRRGTGPYTSRGRGFRGRGRGAPMNRSDTSIQTKNFKPQKK